MPKNWQANLIYAVRRCGRVSLAADLAGISRQRVYFVRRYDPDFAAELEEARKGHEEQRQAAARQRIDRVLVS